MTKEELAEAYRLSALPYLQAEGPMPDPASVLTMRSWRYVFEISSACNLHCALCHAGNREGYQYKPGIMDMDLFERILDKIKSENPAAVVCAYVNSEPLMHPSLPECIASIKRRGLKCEIATNFNRMIRVKEVLDAGPDLFTVSVSGFTQPVYERAHRGGNIETVKANLRELANIKAQGRYPMMIGVSYHMYNDNLDEMPLMKAYVESLGLVFMTSWGRVITMENTIQALRHLEYQKTGVERPYEVKDGMDLNTMLPPAKEDFIKSMERLRFHPAKAKAFYSRWPVSPVCVIADVFTEIRWDGRVQLCAWTDDMRLTVGNYLEMTQEEISAKRRGHPFCKECLRYRLNYYFGLADRTRWEGMLSFEPPEHV